MVEALTGEFSAQPGHLVDQRAGRDGQV
jgi:hypothetical protein